MFGPNLKGCPLCPLPIAAPANAGLQNAYLPGMSIRVGLKLAPQFTTVEELRAIWHVADEAGFDHVWNFDHFASIREDTTGDILEAWTLLGAMAEATKNVRIGCMVTGNTTAHPVLAKMAVTIDHLSDGRLEFGLGAAWAERAHVLGLEFSTVRQRIAPRGLPRGERSGPGPGEHRGEWASSRMQSRTKPVRPYPRSGSAAQAEGDAQSRRER